jgi:energy-coupling factor transporter ATP-binding protein EcfA2
MRIASLKLCNFRCFGLNPTTVELDGLTALVGANGSGKSAILQALARMFGVVQEDRRLQRSDFHLAADTDPEQVNELKLWIEARLEFPEFQTDDGPEDALAECFRHMVLREGEVVPFCRLRLDGSWTRTNVPEGEVDEKLSWLCVPEGAADENKSRIGPHERSRIHVHYLPATRDPAQLMRGVATATLRRLLRAVQWSATIGDKVRQAAGGLRAALEQEPGIQQIEATVTGAWSKLECAQYYKDIKLRPSASQLDEVVRQIAVALSPGPNQHEESVDRLSEGLKSLFYLSLTTAAFQLETEYLASRRAQAEEEPFSLAFEDPPLPTLTIFAVEEPENHLAPFYLRRIMDSFRNLVDTDRSQVLFSSHSPAIIRRVQPEEVRYLRLDESRNAAVRRISLPAEGHDAFKYVHHAVQAHPELYFAKLVILGEGDSEEVVISRLAEAFGVPLDPSFVAVVPLGGRHVNHFWRLLNDLGIPHLTLLDLDREREGGGWGRVHYALEQLLAVGCQRSDLLAVGNGSERRVLTEPELGKMPDRDVASLKVRNGWLGRLESYGVFYSAPLDLDFAMLQAFPEAYHGTADLGPRIPAEGTTQYDERLKGACKAVLKEHGGPGVTYGEREAESFIWYQYLFLGRGKPTTHWQALGTLTEEALRSACPAFLKRLLRRAAERLGEEWKHGNA